MTNETRYIIFDEDVGTDDAWALFMLLKAEQTHNIKILAVTCVGGNASLDNVATNTIRVLEIAKRLDIPVYKGAAEPLINCGPPEEEPFHGVDGLGDLEYSTKPDLSLIKPENAINAMYTLVTMYPKQVTLICTGPLTNVALALKTYSDFGHKIRDIFVMGGNYNAVGNTRRHCTEFNFFVDTEAAFIVLNNAVCPITMLPWEACAQENLYIPMDWRFNVLGNVDHDIIHFMNPIERKIFLAKGFSCWAICDAMLIACILSPNKVIKKSQQQYATIELQGTHTRGQVVIDHRKRKPPNVNIIELIDAEACKEILLWTVNHINIEFS